SSSRPISVRVLPHSHPPPCPESPSYPRPTHSSGLVRCPLPANLAPGKVRQGRREETPAGSPRCHRRASHQPGQHLLLRLGVGVFVVVLVALPCLRVPDLGPRERADHHTVLGEARVAP